jgi:hypothetical protein
MKGTTTLSVVVVCSLVACGAPKRGDDGTGGDDDDMMTPDAGNTNTDNCSEEAKLVYVVDTNNTLSQFNPVTKQFNDLGQLSCPAGFGATPFSMAVDRTAVAWVLYSNGELFRVDTKTLACTKSQWTSQSGLVHFGMGFSTDVAGGTTDTLFICGGPGGPDTSDTSQLATLNMGNFAATPVGTMNNWPELTGTGNAELWGFFPDDQAPRVARIDKGNAQTPQTFPLSSLAGTPMAWAFAFYGGDFWLFLMKSGDTATTVYQVDGTNGQIKGNTPTGGRRIVGAGVSTCAPVIF